jgi:outer membrane murein-binding lipoprotein Lpp
MKSKLVISILLLSMFVFTGCISKSLEEAQVDFCQALVTYGDAVRELQNVDAGTTVEEMEAARDGVADAKEDVENAAGDLREARLRAAEDAWDNTQETIDDISGDATLAEAAATIRGQALILATEIDKITSVSCGRR